MENASKALIMAGSVLIALLVVGALVLMFSNLTSYQNSNEKATKDEQITKFNQEYSTYNRKDVRGNELYSLINRVVDYNRRESTAGTSNKNDETWADKGATIAFEPMEVEFKISAKDKKNISADHSTNRLINQTSWDINGNTNTFTIKQKVDGLEKEFGQDSLTNLVNGMSEIFINTNDQNEKMEAINKFNSACKSKSLKLTEWNKIGPNGDYTKAVYTYYEYIQFKRLHFNCSGVKYSQKTGRIIKLSFESSEIFN